MRTRAARRRWHTWRVRTTRRETTSAPIIGALLALAACGGVTPGRGASADDARATSPTTTTAAPVEPATAPPDETAAARDYGVEAPDGDTTGLPLVVLLHGFGGSGAQVRDAAGLEPAAAARGLRAVFAYPDGTGDEGFPRSWNAGGCCPFANLDGVPDVDFLATLIADVVREYALDPRRVVVAGHSNGGMMAYRLACERPEAVRAIVVGAGALMTDACTPTAPVTVLHLHGALDATVPLAGGATSGIAFPSAERSAGDYARAAGCDGAPPRWTCAGGATVTLEVGPTWSHDWQPEWTARTLDLLESLGAAG